MAAQVLVKLGADLNKVRQQVSQLLGQPVDALGVVEVDPSGQAERPLLNAVLSRINAIDARLSAIGQRVGTGPDTSDLDQQIERLRREKDVAVDSQDYERSASLRDQESELLADLAAREREWAAAHPSLPALAETCQLLSDEIERLRALLRQHGIGGENRTA